MKIGLLQPITTLKCFVNLNFTINQIFLVTVKSVIWSLGGHSTLVCQCTSIVADQFAF